MPDRDKDLENAYRHCVKLARSSGSNFFFAFYSLRKKMFREMCALYAFMRVSDDIGDDESLPLEERRIKLESWRNQLRKAFSGQAEQDLVLRAIVDVSLRKEIPLSLLEEVINGVESDLEYQQFQTFDELKNYCYQVAGVVGICCLKVWECDFSKVQIQQQAIDCGTAFQLTNILRDLSEDAKRGRVYIPREELERFDLSQENFINCQMNATFKEFMTFEVERAWSFYRKAIPLLDNVAPVGKPILCGFFQAYSTLLKQIEQRSYDVFSNRIRLSKMKKGLIVLNSISRRTPGISIPEQENDQLL